MSTYNPSSAFQEAASYLSNVPSLSSVPTAIKLELYGLFKSLTVSPVPNVHRPSIFDLTGRAKWDAWSAAGKGYEHREDAERRYLEIARDLGWTDIIPFAPGKSSVLDSGGAEVSYEGSWDSSKTESSRVGGGGWGMGTSVSAMVPPPFDEKDSKSLHGLAVANNVSGLSSHLDAHPDADINELDEHGYTALHLACDRGNVAAVEHLLSRGADRDVKDPDDLTAFELANVAGHDHIAALIEKTY